MTQINLTSLGLTSHFKQAAERHPNLFIGRVSSQAKNLFSLITEQGVILAEVSGKFNYQVTELAEYPAVGDFVLVDRTDNTSGNAIIHHVLPRKSVFSRKTAGTKDELQIVAANIDTVFICMSLNKDFSLRRLERYLAIAWDSGAMPVVVLTKADLCEDLPRKLSEISEVAIGVEVIVTSSLTSDGHEPLLTFLANGKTGAFIGSSGVGKSTLINRLLGESQLETNGLRNDDKGRHTTTRRELIPLPSSGVVIDTPGMRELGIINANLSKSFADIDELAQQCKFNDCTHTNEPKCVVQAAIAAGELSAERLESYQKLEREAKYEGLNSKMIEKEKLDHLFSEFGGMKNARKYLQTKKKR